MTVPSFDFSSIAIAEAEPVGTCLTLRDYCQKKCAENGVSRPWPRREDIDPFELRAQLPNICMWDVVGSPSRFRCRLIGTRIVAMDGVDATGKWSDECINPKLRDLFLSHYRRVVTEHIWLCHDISFDGLDSRHYRYQRLLIPMGEPNQVPTMIFGAIHFWD